MPLEANRLGVPAVATGRGGLPEIVDEGLTGYLSRPSSSEFTDKILKTLEKGFDRDSVIQASYKKIKPNEQVEKMLKFFEKVT
ncbi:glycosyltransferase [Thermosphaera sp.]